MALVPKGIVGRISNVSKEAARRKVWISVGAYVALSIGLIEISQAVAAALLFPDWTGRLVTFLLILGFPLVVVLAWLFDIGDGGLKRTDAPAATDARVTTDTPAAAGVRPPASRPALRMPIARKEPAPRASEASRVEATAEEGPLDPARVKRAALGHVRHELRTPINAILGYSEMLLEDEPPAESIADLERIRAGGRQLLQLVDSILDAHRIESESGRDLESYAAQIEADLRTPITSVVGYCEMLIEAENESGRAGMVSDLERIQRSARALLETSGDIVRVAGQADASAAMSATSAMTSGILAKLRPVRSGTAEDGEGSLLVVDDNDTNRDLLTRQLARHGYMVATARDGVEALEHMRRQAVDLVLLDVIMPNMDGVEALRQIKGDERLRDTSVIMLSSLDETDSAVRCLELGAEEYLSKPVHGALLEARIRANLAVRRLRTREQALSDRLAEDHALVNDLLTDGLPSAMADRVRAGESSFSESWPTAAVLCLELDPVPFGAGATDAYVAFLSDAQARFDEAVLGIDGIHGRLSGRPGLVAFSLMDEGGGLLAAPLLDLAGAFLAGLGADDKEAPALFRGGIHSGPLVGSLFGSRRPRFELWGDGLDVAQAVARIADPGCVLLTPPAKALLGDTVGLESIGVRDVGRRGSMRLYRMETR